LIAERNDDGKWLVREEYDAYGVGDSFGLVRLSEFSKLEISEEDRRQLRKDIEKNCTVHFLIFCEPSGEYSLWFNRVGVVGLHRAFKDLLNGSENWIHGGTPPALGSFYEFSVAYYLGSKAKLERDSDYLNCHLSDIDTQLFNGNAT